MEKILILGVTGMLGHSLFFNFKSTKHILVKGTARSVPQALKAYEEDIYGPLQIHELESLKKIFEEWKPTIVINCIGVIKQLKEASDPIPSITINSLFPHQVSKLCKEYSSRFIHISTDCVFDGKTGSYTEDSLSNAYDLYGKSKALGEISHEKHVLTLRTSIIGHELSQHLSLVDWFLKAPSPALGYTQALYSGLPTYELARVLKEYVFPRKDLCGLFHVASNPISKFDLLDKINHTYTLNKRMEASNQVIMDRTLVAKRFSEVTGYSPPSWDILIQDMYKVYLSFPFYLK